MRFVALVVLFFTISLNCFGQREDGINFAQFNGQNLEAALKYLRQKEGIAISYDPDAVSMLTIPAIDAQINNVDMNQILAQGIPGQARDMLGMFGFRIKINVHGEVVAIDQPSVPDEE